MRENPPVKQFIHGCIVGSIWRATRSDPPTYACTFERRYLDPDDGARKSSLSFTHLDLLALIRVALDAAAYLTVAESEEESSRRATSLRRERIS